jgi:hypothetical protein
MGWCLEYIYFSAESKPFSVVKAFPAIDFIKSNWQPCFYSNIIYTFWGSSSFYPHKMKLIQLPSVPKIYQAI